jgi:hypothetical protein
MYVVLLTITFSFSSNLGSSEDKPLRLATIEEKNKYLIPESIGYFQPRDEAFWPVVINIYGSNYKIEYGLPFPALSAGEYRAKYYNYHYLDLSITMAYSYIRDCSENKEASAPECPGAGPLITKYKDPEHIKQDIINFYMESWWELKHGRKKGTMDIEVVTFKGKELLFLKTERSEGIIWQSDEFAISLTFGEGGNSEDSSLLQAYMDKYPPTWTIKVDDFNPELAIKTEMDRYLEIISEFEKKRITLDKHKIYEAMNYQCEFESNIRCWTGETGRGCPITMELNNLKRKNKFKEFADEARKKPVDTEKYHSMAMFVTECQVLDQEAAIAHELGILQDMIKK